MSLRRSAGEPATGRHGEAARHGRGRSARARRGRRMPRSVGDDVIAADRSTLDITDRDAVIDAVRAIRPDAIINAAAYTAVDACETNVELAYAANADAVGHLADGSRRGRRPPRPRQHRLRVRRHARPAVPRGRRDQPAVGVRPVEAGGRTGGRCRTPRSCAPRGCAASTATTWSSSCSGWRAQAGDLAFVDDQRGCPTFTADLAPALRPPGRRATVRRAPPDQPGAVTWYEFVQEVLAAAGHDPARGPPDLDRRTRPAAPGAAPGQQRARQRRVARRRASHRSATSAPRSPNSSTD